MSAKQLIFDADARRQLKTGIDALANAVKVTLGPRDQGTGAEILKRALQEPLRQLVANAGLEGSVVVEHLSHEKRANWGFDVLAEAYVDMLEAGIIDPAKVTRSALENAASVAGMILSTVALVTDLQERHAVGAASGSQGMYD